MAIQTPGSALNQIQELLVSAQPHQAPKAAVYVFPGESDAIRLDIEFLPVIIVAQSFRPDTELYGRTVHGKAAHRWEAEVLLFVDGFPKTQDAAADAEVKLRAWDRVIANILWRNQTLGNTCRRIGDDGGPPMQLVLFRVANRGAVMWMNQQFFGMRMLIPIWQEYNQDMHA